MILQPYCIAKNHLPYKSTLNGLSSFEKSYDIALQREYPKMHNSRIPKMHNSKIPRNIQSMICIWLRTAIAFLMNQAQNYNAGSCYHVILLAINWINQHQFIHIKKYISMSASNYYCLTCLSVAVGIIFLRSFRLLLILSLLLFSINWIERIRKGR